MKPSMLDTPLTEADRFPLLTDRSRAMLRRLQQHAHAPRWTYQCGDRLDAAGLADVEAFAALQRSQRRGWRFGETPAWVPDFIDRCRREVPFYRERLASGQLPTCNREDLRREPWAFVPDSADVSELIVYRTSGTSGNLLQIPAHPVAPARWPLRTDGTHRQASRPVESLRQTMLSVCVVPTENPNQSPGKRTICSRAATASIK